MGTNILEKPAASIFKAEHKAEQKKCDTEKGRGHRDVREPMGTVAWNRAVQSLGKNWQDA
jgi:hypothetical protein